MTKNNNISKTRALSIKFNDSHFINSTEIRYTHRSKLSHYIAYCCPWTFLSYCMITYTDHESGIYNLVQVITIRRKNYRAIATTISKVRQYNSFRSQKDNGCKSRTIIIRELKQTTFCQHWRQIAEEGLD